MNVKNTEITTPKCLIADYGFLRLLGEGTSGKTYLAIRRADNRRVAVKALKFDSTFKSMELFEREAETLSGIDVPGVPKFYGYVKSSEDIGEAYLIQEYVEYPSLQYCLDHDRVFSEREVRNIILSVVEILKHLQMDYTPPIIHRDIKPSNILFDEVSGRCVLIDFGAVANPQRKSMGSTVAGTVGFMAPEQLMGDCTIQSDYYALGATALNLLSGVSPVEMEHAADDPFKLEFRPYLPNSVSENMIGFLDSLLAVKCNDRPKNINEIIAVCGEVFGGDDERDGIRCLKFTVKNKKIVRSVNRRLLIFGILFVVLLLIFLSVRIMLDFNMNYYIPAILVLVVFLPVGLLGGLFLNVMIIEYRPSGFEVFGYELNHGQFASITDADGDMELSPQEAKEFLFPWKVAFTVIYCIINVILFCYIYYVLHNDTWSLNKYWNYFTEVAITGIYGFLFCIWCFPFKEALSMVVVSNRKEPKINLYVLKKSILGDKTYYESCFMGADGLYSGYVFEDSDLVMTGDIIKLRYDSNVKQVIDNDNIIDKKKVSMTNSTSNVETLSFN